MSILSLDSFDKQHPLYGKVTSLGMPHTKTEQYRNFPIRQLLEREYTFKNLEFIKMKEGNKLIIEDGVVIECPQGVKITYDKTVLADEAHYDVLYFSSHILAQVVISLEIQEDIKFEIQHVFHEEDTLISYRIALKILANIKVDIFESFNLKATKNSLVLYGVDVIVEDDATLVWIRSENRDENEATLIGTHKYNVAKHSALELKTFDYGSANSLHLYKIDLQDYAWLDATHLLLATKGAKRGNVLQINHNKPYAKSVQEARSILKDNATGIFDAKIRVAHEAPYSNASQNSKAILLDEHARMYAKPQLEIYIDELEASHGSSIGRLDENALFYLCSRGIHRENAKSMLILAFANRLINTVKDKNYTKKIHETFEFLL